MPDLLERKIRYARPDYPRFAAPISAGRERRWIAALRFLLIFAVASRLAEPVLAQDQTNGWVAYTSMKEINRLLVLEGKVWSATSGGVLCFDQAAQTYTRFTRLNGLAGNKVLSVTADGRGHLWFGTDQDGLSRFRPETGTFDRPFRDFQDLRVRALVAAANRIFVGMDKGVSAFLIDKEEVKETYRNLGRFPKDTEVTALAVFDGRLWAGTIEGMAWADLSLPNLQDPDSWNTNNTIGPVQDLLVSGEDLFAAGRSGVYFFNFKNEEFVLGLLKSQVKGLGMFAGKVIAATDGGRFYQRHDVGDWEDLALEGIAQARALSRADTALWVATAEGLKVVGTEPPPPPHEPAANLFYEIEVVADEEVWVASVPDDHVLPRKGLYQFDGTGWTVHNRKTGLPSDMAVTLETDAAGQLWVGTWGSGLAVRDTSGTWQRLNESNSVLRGIGASQTFVAISDIVRDPAGLMWIANVQIGLAVMDGYPPDQSLLYEQGTLGLPKGRDIGKMAIGPDGLKWIATGTDGFILFDDGGTPFTPGDEFALLINTIYDSRLTSDRVADIAVDAGGQVWVGTNNGLNAVRGIYSRATESFQVDTWRVYGTGDGLPSSVISALAADSRGNVWVATETGLTQIGPDSQVAVTLTTANSGLIDNRINSLLFDRQSGALWIGTLDGLSRLQVTRGSAGRPAPPRVYPNPFLLGPGTATLTFADLPLGASLRIFALDGQLVRELEGTPGQATVSWNGQNASGFLVGSGVYFFVAADPAGNRVKGKFAVINTQ